MKVLVVLALALATVATVAAMDLRKSEVYGRDIFMPVINEDAEGRITGGKTASAGQFPYQVGLSLAVNGGSAWCGGSLLGSTWVLTAAHCVDGVSSVTVYLGATVRTSPRVTHTVAKSAITIHSGWNSKTLRNDIALIKIPSTATSSYIGYVKMPAVASTYSTYAGSAAIASGWGRTSDSSTAVASNLQYATMTVITNAVCSNTYGSTIQSTNICVSTPGGVSTCNGDSGGPLVLSSNKELIGVVSFGSSAGCTKGYPAAFSRVTSYRSWIKDLTGI